MAFAATPVDHRLQLGVVGGMGDDVGWVGVVKVEGVGAVGEVRPVGVEGALPGVRWCSRCRARRVPGSGVASARCRSTRGSGRGVIGLPARSERLAASCWRSASVGSSCSSPHAHNERRDPSATTAAPSPTGALMIAHACDHSAVTLRSPLARPAGRSRRSCRGSGRNASGTSTWAWLSQGTAGSPDAEGDPRVARFEGPGCIDGAHGHPVGAGRQGQASSSTSSSWRRGIRAWRRTSSRRRTCHPVAATAR